MLMNSLFGLIPLLASYLLDLVFIYMILTTYRSKITNILTWVTNIILSFGLFVIITRMGFMNLFVGYLLGCTAIVCDIFLFKEEYYKIIFVSLGIWSISSFFSSAAISISNIFFKVSPYIIFSNPSHNVVFFRSLVDISMYISFLCIFYFYLRKPMKKILNLSSKINYFYYTVPFIAFILFCAIFGPTKEHNTFFDFILMTIMFFIILSLYYLIFSSIYHTYNKDLLEIRLDAASKQYEMQKEYYKLLNDDIEKSKAHKHDIHHHLNTISTLTANKDYDTLEKYMSRLMFVDKEILIDRLSMHPVVDAVIQRYIRISKATDILISTEINIPENIAIDSYDLCIILGNCLENSIEACTMVVDPYNRYIIVKTSMIGNNLLIDIENSFNGVINIENNKIITTKNDGQNHGIGLKNVRSIVNNYNGNMNITYLDNKFRVSIMICAE